MPSTFPTGRPEWISRLGRVRNVVRQEVISRYLSHHLVGTTGTVLDVGAGQGTQSLRLARRGFRVTAVEPDPEMRRLFTSALAAEDREVRARVELIPGELDDLPRIAGEQGHDLVLLLGVLMYLPSSTRALEMVAAHVRPGGIAALAVRTTTSALWRPAARGDWAEALAAFAEQQEARREQRDVEYVNELGTPARAVDLDGFIEAAESLGLRLEQWYGVRVAVDAEELDPAPPADPQELADLIDVEERLGSMEPFRQLGQLALIVLRRSG